MKRHLAFALPLVVAACSTPSPPPKPVTAPPVAAPAPPPPPLDWRDKPYTPGLWRYADRTAVFGPAGTSPLLILQCDGARHVVLSVAGAVPTLTIRTSYGERSWPTKIGSDGRSAVSFAGGDAALDQIAFSRGRFSVAGPGLAEIDIPAWAEPARVIEDCRS